MATIKKYTKIKVNPERFDRFFTEFTKAFKEELEDYPERYQYVLKVKTPPVALAEYKEKLHNYGAISMDTSQPVFKIACRRVGIHTSGVAITNFIMGNPAERT